METKRLTIYDIKYLVEKTEPYFFNRRTMRFFGQTLRDYKVRVSPSGRVYIFAPIIRNKTITVGYTVKEYDVATNKLISVPFDHTYNSALQEYHNIISYINTH